LHNFSEDEIPDDSTKYEKEFSTGAIVSNEYRKLFENFYGVEKT